MGKKARKSGQRTRKVGKEEGKGKNNETKKGGERSLNKREEGDG